MKSLIRSITEVMNLPETNANEAAGLKKRGYEIDLVYRTTVEKTVGVYVEATSEKQAKSMARAGKGEEIGGTDWEEPWEMEDADKIKEVNIIEDYEIDSGEKED